ncbi:uncharacterized protein LOC127245143 [Andrographis paniculata]|uniref:uncharacterized protein LOC127245143 n=1 Tax=Andrographis paniculata TaxID=175694 RepID=UPI0021E7E863|nr:uncharacterized protein LOC127245143 [Andrographis paniculata]
MIHERSNFFEEGQKKSSSHTLFQVVQFLSASMEKKEEPLKINKVGNSKWHGSVQAIVNAPIEKVWSIVSHSSRLHEWMPMVEKCTSVSGQEGIPGYVRLVSGLMFPQKDRGMSWIKERLILIDPLLHTYTFQMEESNIGLDGSLNSLKLIDYGDGTTLVDWKYDIDPANGMSKDNIIDYLGYLYKSCINRIEGALKASSKLEG